MQLARSLIVLSCAAFAAACGTDVAIVVNSAPSGGLDAAIPPVGPPDNPPPCTTRLEDRMYRTSITLSEGVRYRRADPYFFGYPQDDRVALAAWGTHGAAMVAWLNAAGTKVHVTPLTQRFARLTNDLSDYVVDGTELSGLVAHDDGFAVLTRRVDPGEAIGPGTPPSRTQATYLVRRRFASGEEFDQPLTGTASIVSGVPENDRRDHPEVNPASIGLSGRLVHNGTNYGAYFTSEGGVRDRLAGTSSDKLVQVDNSGQYVSSWRGACRQSLGGRIIPEPSGFTVFCMSDGVVGEPGINAVGASGTPRFLAEQMAPQTGDYLGGNFGAALKTPVGYLVAWASRGIDYENNTVTYAHEAHEPATMAVSTELVRVAGTRDWPFLANGAQPARDAVNVHAALYGGDKVLLVWETIDMPQYRLGAGYGAYGGTHLRLVDFQGKTASDEERILDHIAPNGQDDIVSFPNGDVAWAYVREPERNFQAPVAASNVTNLPPLTQIHFVRIQHCQP
jgi:hypothetical protein